ncbi:MAG: signal peptidase II [Clostridia bacterium]|jgi:signal peptidase II
MVWIIIILGITSVDQLLKYFVVANIQGGSSLVIIKDFFQLTYVENTGVAFSIFQNMNYVLIPVMIVISVFVVRFLIKSKSNFMSLSLSFILGGALGNLIDRIFRGNVVDFLDFQIMGRHFFIFNPADTFIVVGTALLAFYLIFIYKEKDKASG